MAVGAAARLAGATEAVVVLEKVNHYFGQGALRKQILFDISMIVQPGEIVILTGPSGSGKTTVLTLIGGLRSTQEGSLKVLGHELRGASGADLERVRKSIGYIFQAHNLLDALTATQNVQMSFVSEPRPARAEADRMAKDVLGAVGLSDRTAHYPHQLSGGQKQRVAIARALASKPRIILADEPTASLDKKSGRDVVDLMHDLAKRQGTAVLLVTHDNRILDIADRIVHLEDGRLKGFQDAVLANTQQMLSTLAQYNRKGELARRVKDLSPADFAGMMDQVTGEVQQFLQVIASSNLDTFESMLEQVLEAFTLKIGQVLDADRATLFLVDPARGILWSKVAQAEGEKALDIRIPLGEGIAGHVARTGEVLNIPDAYASPLFNRDVDRRTGYRTRSILCAPILDTGKRTFAVAQLLNKKGQDAFDAEDEQKLREFAGSIGVILESWWRMSQRDAAVSAST
jgi:putative ABC transport system ATP-binding protein